MASSDASAQPPAPETSKPDAITTRDVAALDRIAGREIDDAERAPMLASLAETRDSLKAVRTSVYAENQSPAFVFDPIPDGVRIPRTSKSPERAPALARGSEPPYDNHPESLAFADVPTLARLLRRRRVTSTALTRMYLERLKTYGPRLLSVVSLTEELALAQAAQADAEIAAGKWRGPLHGVPYGVKDLFDALGTSTTFGAPPYKNRKSAVDATVVARLHAAGAVLCAKFSMGELAMGDIWFGGTTRNPWNPAQGSSGSSAGSASSVAAGLVGFALGTETYGSIVSPSMRCGVTGLRPTFGRVSRHGAMALSWTMDKIGPIARGVEDCAIILAAIHGPDDHDASVLEGVPFDWRPGRRLDTIRVGYDRAAFEKASDAHKAVLDVLKKLGVDAKPIDLPKNEPAYEAIADVTIIAEGAAAFAQLAASGGLSELVQQGRNDWHNQFRVGATIPASDYLQAQRVRRHLQKAVSDSLDGIDVYVTPAGAQPSLQHGNVCGLPTVATRCGATASGIPVTIEFVGNLFCEAELLRVARAYEQATPWHKQWPDVDKLPNTPPPIPARRPAP